MILSASYWVGFPFNLTYSHTIKHLEVHTFSNLHVYLFCNKLQDGIITYNREIIFLVQNLSTESFPEQSCFSRILSYHDFGHFL